MFTVGQVSVNVFANILVIRKEGSFPVLAFFLSWMELAIGST